MNRPLSTRKNTVSGAAAALRLAAAALLLLSAAGCGKVQRAEQPGTAGAQTPPPADRLTVRAELERDTIHVGEPVRLSLSLWYPPGGKVQIPPPGGKGNITVLDRDWTDLPAPTNGPARTDVHFTLTSFRFGDHALFPSNAQAVCIVGTNRLTAPMPNLTLHVTGVLKSSADTQLDDIKPPVKPAPRIPRWVWVTLGAALLAFLLGRMAARRRRAPRKKPGPPPPPPHVRALQALEELERRGWIERGEGDPFYTELSMILRRYLEDRFNLNAPEETTEEIIEELSRSPVLSGAQRNLLQEFLRQADLVKFAKAEAPRESMEGALDTARNFIEETAPRPEAEGGNGEGKEVAQ